MSPYKDIQRAAALKYQPDSPHSAPVVVASGLGYAAEKIIEVAEKNHVPVYQDDSLATILSQFYAGSEIPKELYQAIVDIYVYFLNFTVDGNKLPGAASAPGGEDGVRQAETAADASAD